jgi:hypothetical protein
MRHLLAAAGLALAAASPALADNLVVSTSIQAAVDAARPGDTIVVPPGRYHESVRIQTSRITVRGSRGAVLDASGFAVGIRAARGLGGQGCAAPTLSEIAIDGLRIENASFTGVLLRGVDGFIVRDGLYTGNEEYAISRSAPRTGLSSRTMSREPTTRRSTSAIRTTSLSNATTRLHRRHRDRELDRPARPRQHHDRQYLRHRHLRSPRPPGSGDRGRDDRTQRRHAQQPPEPRPSKRRHRGADSDGSGILTVGADRVSIRDNWVVGNDSGGIAVVALQFPNDPPRRSIPRRRSDRPQRGARERTQPGSAPLPLPRRRSHLRRHRHGHLLRRQRFRDLGPAGAGAALRLWVVSQPAPAA